VIPKTLFRDLYTGAVTRIVEAVGTDGCDTSTDSWRTGRLW
jgi:hypothetical protein